MRTDVVICGAGVAGLAAAHALGRSGRRVLLLDKQSTFTRAAKGEVLQPGALEILREWGVIARLEERGALRLSRLVACDRHGNEQMALEYGALPGQHAWLLAAEHATILRALAATLPDTVDFRQGVLVREALRADGRVAGVALKNEQVRADLVVAADGVSSRLRGTKPEKKDYPHRLVALDIPGSVKPDFTAYVSGRGLRLMYPLPGGRVRLYVQTEPDELRGLDQDALRRWSDGLVAELPVLASLAIRDGLATRQLLPVSRFLARKLAEPGLALVGESGHTVHPMAAQGMNSAIADADRLAFQLASNPDPERALRAYAAERLPSLVRIGQTSHNAARMLTDLSWVGRTLGRRALRHTGRNERLRYTVMHNMSGLGEHPLSPLDRLFQLGLLPDPRASRRPVWA